VLFVRVLNTHPLLYKTSVGKHGCMAQLKNSCYSSQKKQQFWVTKK